MACLAKRKSPRDERLDLLLSKEVEQVDQILSKPCRSLAFEVWTAFAAGRSLGRSTAIPTDYLTQAPPQSARPTDPCASGGIAQDDPDTVTAEPEPETRGRWPTGWKRRSGGARPPTVDPGRGLRARDRRSWPGGRDRSQPPPHRRRGPAKQRPRPDRRGRWG